MKIAIVPAQVTTVEDKVAGNLTLTQLILLVVPVFCSGVLYAVMPPSFGVAIYKIIIIILLFIVVGSLAIKIRGRLLVAWLIILLRYNARPMYYVLDKNDNYLRDNEAQLLAKVVAKKQDSAETKRPFRHNTPPIAVHDKARFEAMIADPHSKLSFKISRKGGLDVNITEVE